MWRTDLSLWIQLWYRKFSLPLWHTGPTPIRHSLKFWCSKKEMSYGKMVVLNYIWTPTVKKEFCNWFSFGFIPLLKQPKTREVWTYITKTWRVLHQRQHYFPMTECVSDVCNSWPFLCHPFLHPKRRNRTSVQPLWSCYTVSKETYIIY